MTRYESFSNDEISCKLRNPNCVEMFTLTSWIGWVTILYRETRPTSRSSGLVGEGPPTWRSSHDLMLDLNQATNFFFLPSFFSIALK